MYKQMVPHNIVTVPLSLVIHISTVMCENLDLCLMLGQGLLWGGANTLALIVFTLIYKEFLRSNVGCFEYWA